MDNIQNIENNIIENPFKSFKAPGILGLVAGVCALGLSIFVSLLEPDSTDLWLGQYKIIVCAYLIINSLLLIWAGHLYNRGEIRMFSRISLILFVSVVASLFLYDSYDTLAVGLDFGASLFTYILLGGLFLGFHLVSPLFLLSTTLNSIMALRFLSKNNSRIIK